MTYQSIKSAHIASEAAMRPIPASVQTAFGEHLDFIAIEANRQRGLLIRALEAQGRGDQAEVTKLLKELQTPQAKKGTYGPNL